MALVYNFRKKRNEEVSNNLAARLFNTPQSGYMPVPSAKYLVIDPASGDTEEVPGSLVRRKLSENYLLGDLTTQRMVNLARSKNSPLGAFARKALDEALTLGIGEAIESKPKNELEALYEDTFRREFQTSRTLGGITGLLAPLVAGGIGGAIAKKASSKMTARMLTGAPSALAIKGINKAGDAAARQALKLAGKAGIRNKTALKGAEVAGRLTGWAAGDAALFAGKRSIEAGISADYDRSFNIRAALQEGVRAGPEIMKSSFLISGALMGGFKSVATGLKLTSKVGKGIGRFTGKAVEGMDLANSLRREFFNSGNSQKYIARLKNNIGSSYRFMRESLPSKSLKKLWDDLPESEQQKIKYHTKQKEMFVTDDFLRKNIKSIIGKSSERNVLLLMSDYIRKANFGKFPKNRQEGFQIVQRKQAMKDLELRSLRDRIFKLYENKNLEINHYKNVFRTAPDIWKKLLHTDSAVQVSALNRIKSMDLKRTKEIGAKKAKRLDDFVYANKEHKKMYEFIHRLSQRSGGKYTFDKEPVKEMNEFLEWLVAKSARSDQIKRSVDIIKSQNQKDLFKLWDKEGLPVSILPIVKNKLAMALQKQPQQFDMIVDMFKLDYILSKGRKTLGDAKNFDDIVKRWSRYKDPERNPILKATQKALSNSFDELMPKEYYMSPTQFHRITNYLSSQLSKFAKVTSASSYQNKINRLRALVTGKTRLNIFDINEIMKIVGELGKHQKLKKASTAENAYRRFYNFLTQVEDDMVLGISRKGDFSSDIAKSFISAKGELSLSTVLIDSLDKQIKNLISGHPTFMRDILFATGGLGGGIALAGGAPLVGLGITLGAWAGTKAVASSVSKANYFLYVAEAIDQFSGNVAKQRQAFEMFKNKQRLGTYLRAATSIPDYTINANTLGFLFLGEEAKSLEELNMKLAQMPEYKKLAGNGDIYSVVAEVGGEPPARAFNTGLTDLKHLILSSMPQGTMNKTTGVRTFSKYEKNRFYRSIAQAIYPSNFLNDVKNGQLSTPQIQAFATLYPEHFNSLVISIVEGLKDGTIKPSAKLKESIDTLFGSQKGSMIFHLDMLRKDQEQESARTQRAGGIKFSTISQPTMTERVGNL